MTSRTGTGSVHTWAMTMTLCASWSTYHPLITQKNMHLCVTSPYACKTINMQFLIQRGFTEVTGDLRGWLYVLRYQDSKATHFKRILSIHRTGYDTPQFSVRVYWREQVLGGSRGHAVTEDGYWKCHRVFHGECSDTWVSKYGRDQACCWGALVCCRGCNIEWCVSDINREMNISHNWAVFIWGYRVCLFEQHVSA